MKAAVFLDECLERKFSFFTGTPCSYLKPFINYAIDHPKINFVDATNEGDAVAMAAGAWLGGTKAVVMFQNSGLGNAVNPITSLSCAFEIPFLGITTLRGDPEGEADEPQHTLMGSITTKLLDLMNVGWSFFPETEAEVSPTLAKAEAFMENEKRPFFFVMKKGAIDRFELKAQEPGKPSLTKKTEAHYASRDLATRTEVLHLVHEFSSPNMAVIATTGKTGRELFEVKDSVHQFYMVGSMGCAPSLGLGLSLVAPSVPCVVIDGDGALLMRMGAMASVGRFQPKKFIHLLIDNGAHDSTGGQKTGSELIDFLGIARSCRYQSALGTDQISVLREYLEYARRNEGPHFLHMKVKLGSPENLGRPTVKPIDVAARFREKLKTLR
jgi:phosphonopyruvate decarboxylase